MNKKLDSIQVLRALAAISVVAHHTFRATTYYAKPASGSLVPPLWLVQMGAAGVDIFFVISGFLMAYISGAYLSGQRAPREFFAQRVIRIWPPYAVVTAFACALTFRYRGNVWPYDLTPSRLLSFIFVPSFNEKAQLQPIIGPGWTLNYEMFFYLCFTLTLWVSRSRPMTGLSLIICSAFGIGLLAPPGVIHGFLGNPIILEFLIGALIGFAIKREQFSPTLGFVWIGLSIVTIAAFYLCGLGEGERLIAYGIPSALLFVGFIALQGKVSWPTYFKVLGDASYSIYLVHILVIYRVINIGFFERHAPSMLATTFTSWFSVGCAAAVGLAFYFGIERPLLRICHRIYARLHRDSHPAEQGVAGFRYLFRRYPSKLK